MLVINKKPYLPERVQMLYSNLYGSIFGLIPYLLVMGVVYYHSATLRGVTIWAVCAIFAATLEWSFLHRYMRHGPGRHSAEYWANMLTFCSGLTGLTTSLGAVFLIHHGDTGQALIAAAFLFTPVLGSATIGGFYLPTHIVYACAQILPFGFWLVAAGERNLMLFGVMGMLTALPISIFWALRMHKSTLNIIGLRDENRHLLEQMRVEKARAEEANLMKSKFIASASHDLRQPIHAMGLFFEVLKKTQDPDEQTRIKEKIDQSLRLLQHSFDEILDISRLDSGVIVANRECINFREFQKNLVTEYQAKAQAVGIELRTVTQNINIYTDLVLLSRIIRNLLENAIRHSSARKILFGSRRHRSHLDIFVIDQGKGIPVDELDNVTDAFYQLDSSAEGCGLGLTIVARLCELLEHPIHFSSRPGRGTTVHITVPTCEVTTSRPAKFMAQNKSLQMKSCLVIDNDLPVVEGSVGLLRKWGCTVYQAVDWLQVKEIVDKGVQLDFMICDVRLARDIWGPDLVQRFYEYCRRTIPCLLVTGETDPRILKKLRDSGHTIAVKPVSPANFRLAIDAILE